MTAIAFLGKQSTENGHYTLSFFNLQYYLYYLLLIEATRKQYYNLKNHKEKPRTISILQLKITVLYLNIMLNYNLFLWLKLYFSIITAVFSVTWSSEDLCSEIFYNNSTVVLLHIFSGFFDEYNVQKSSIDLKQKYWISIWMSFLSLLINSTHPCWIKVFISFRNIISQTV